jgi:hypothetical protein
MACEISAFNLPHLRVALAFWHDLSIKLTRDQYLPYQSKVVGSRGIVEPCA